ncbi:MAG: hypothetical protein ACFFBD_10785, partial [Candidatus Hodarchaeota archaeon]
MDEKSFSIYNGVKLFQTEAIALKKLTRQAMMVVRHVEESEFDKVQYVGFSSNENHVTGLAIMNLMFLSPPEDLENLIYLKKLYLCGTWLDSLPESLF